MFNSEDLRQVKALSLNMSFLDVLGKYKPIFVQTVFFAYFDCFRLLSVGTCKAYVDIGMLFNFFLCVSVRFHEHNPPLL